VQWKRVISIEMCGSKYSSGVGGVKGGEGSSTVSIGGCCTEVSRWQGRAAK